MDPRPPPPPGRPPSARGCAPLALPAPVRTGPRQVHRGRSPGTAAASPRSPPLPPPVLPPASSSSGSSSPPPEPLRRAPRAPRGHQQLQQLERRGSATGAGGKELAERGAKARGWAGGRLTLRQRPGPHPCHPPVPEAERPKPRHWTLKLFPVFRAPAELPGGPGKGGWAPTAGHFPLRRSHLGRGGVTSCGLDSTGPMPLDPWGSGARRTLL